MLSGDNLLFIHLQSVQFLHFHFMFLFSLVLTSGSKGNTNMNGKKNRKNKQKRNKGKNLKAHSSQIHGSAPVNNTEDNNIDTNAVPQERDGRPTKKALLLGDSHVRPLDEDKLKKSSIISAGIGGLKSSQLHSRHRQTINSELTTATDVIIHIGSNDISKNIPMASIVDNIDTAAKKLKEVNPEVKIAISSIFLQGYDTSKNIRIVETNQAIKNLCLAHGWDFLDHGNIAFKHLDSEGMHLNPAGNRLFARNIINYVKSD